MLLVPQMPGKAQYLQEFSFPQIKKLCKKTATEQFVGGRPGYDKELLFGWLLVKKVMHWDYRTIASMAGVSHSTLVRANEFFLRNRIYERVLADLVRRGVRKGFVSGAYIAMDSSFVHTFSKRGELGSEGWNDHKEGFGFKLHLLVDCETKFPLALSITNGLAHDMTLAIPLLKQAKRLVKQCGYVLADKGYDWGELVRWIVQNLNAKAGIPIAKRKRGKNYTWEGSFRNFQLKAKGRSIKKSIYNRRTAIERVFSVLKRTYHLGKEETRGILNFAKNCYLALICYILKLFYIAKSS